MKSEDEIGGLILISYKYSVAVANTVAEVFEKVMVCSKVSQCLQYSWSRSNSLFLMVAGISTYNWRRNYSTVSVENR